MRTTVGCHARSKLDTHQRIGLSCAIGAMLWMTLITFDPGLFGTVGGSIAVSLAFSSVVAFATRRPGPDVAAVAGRISSHPVVSSRRAA